MSKFASNLNDLILKSNVEDDDIDKSIIDISSQEASSNFKLSDSQSRIVRSNPEGNIIVAAGAGSGKTRVLTERIKYLITECNVNPSDIVAITFTNAAAEEMKSRLSDVSGISSAFIGTIHSFANKIYHNSGVSYRIYTDSAENDLYKELIARYCSVLTFELFMHWKDVKSQVQLGLLPESDLQTLLLPSEKEELRSLSKDHPDSNETHFVLTVPMLRRQRNYVTFDELLGYTSDYFKSLNAKIEYVFVDEFQDIGSLEFNFIKSLNAKNYFFVGDDWQSIYAFKGGNVQFFKSLMSKNSKSDLFFNRPFRRYKLGENYRNAAVIAALGSDVIHQLPSNSIIEKSVRCINSNPGYVEIASHYKLRKYLSQIAVDQDYRDWFILVRTNRDLVMMQSVLASMRIPYVSFKRSDNSSSEIKGLMNSNSVKLLTVHTSKGLESKNVMLVGNFPLDPPSYRSNPNERKVMYVGITRAIEKLIILN